MCMSACEWRVSTHRLPRLQVLEKRQAELRSAWDLRLPQRLQVALGCRSTQRFSIRKIPAGSLAPMSGHSRSPLREHARVPLP